MSFEHTHAAHCESGVVSALLRHEGLDLSEAMVFGLSSALTFVHMPWVKVGGVPLTAYRMWPGAVMTGVRKALGIGMETRRYRRARDARDDLDRRLAAGQIVGLQTSVYWLPYFPPDMRFHFNAHNLIVFGRDGDDYLISDPVFEEPVRCAAAALDRARFARGTFAPRGKLYRPRAVPTEPDLARAVRRAVRKTANRMLRAPLPFVGVRGIRLLARTVARLPSRYPDSEYPLEYIGSVIRMQEEIGTGGAGFRFMYGAFLQEAATLCDEPGYREAADKMTETGDTWREFALAGARLYKRQDAADFDHIARLIEQCAEQEQQVFRFLLELR